MKRPVVVLGILLLGAAILDYVRTKIANYEMEETARRAEDLVHRQQRLVDDYYRSLESCRLPLDHEAEQGRARIVASLRIGAAYKKALLGDKRSIEYLAKLGIMAPAPGQHGRPTFTTASLRWDDIDRLVAMPH